MLAYQVRPPEKELVGAGWRQQWLERLDQMPFWPELWLRHPVRDAYWKHGSVCEDWSAIQVPVFALDGWADAYTNTVLHLMEHLQVPRKAIIGPWAHVYPHDGTPAPAIGFLQEAVRRWDHWLKGEENGIMDGPMVQAWIQDAQAPSAQFPASAGRWVGAREWPAPEVKATPWHLGYGRLAPKPLPAAGSVALRTPQNHGLLAGEWMGAGVPGESPSDQRLDDGQALVFDGEALAEPLEIFGYPEFQVELASDKPAAMLYARLSDVAPDGSVRRVSYGLLNLTHAQGHVDRRLHYDIVTDTWTCVTDGVGGVFGEGVYRFDDIDTTVEHNLRRELTLRNGDPLSARYDLIQTMKIGREGWKIDAEITVSMTGDRTHFNLSAEMDVKENGAPAFRKTWHERVPREGL